MIFSQVIPRKETAFETKRKARAEAQFILDLFDELPDPIPLYRVVSVTSKEQIDLSYPGDHWSFNEQSAKTFASVNLLGRSVFLLKCFTPKSNVIWGNTLRNYMEYSGVGIAESENEIMIESSANLLNVKILKQLK
jgi:hypothetical protein